MGSVVDLLPAIRAGRVAEQVEARRIGCEFGQPTKGHRTDEPGLRGHSVGDTWPYRVVGKGDGTWEVHRNGCTQVLTGLTCHYAHRTAKQLAQGRLSWLMR